MERLKALTERWPWLKTALAVHERVGETNGSAVASATTVMFFVAIFPLLLVAIAVVGFLAAGDENLTADLIESLGVEGQAADAVERAIDTAESSRRTASIVGFAGLAWSGLGVTAALTLAVLAPWQRKAQGVKAKLNGLLWLGGGVVTFGGSLAAGAVLNRLPGAVPRPVTAAGLIAVGLALELAFFLWTFWALGERRPGWRALLPGAIVGAIGLEALKLAGTVLLPRMVASSSSLYGPLGVVFAILAWLTLFSRLVVYASALNAVRWEQEHGTAELTVRAVVFDGERPVEADRGGAVIDLDPESDSDTADEPTGDDPDGVSGDSPVAARAGAEG